MKLACGKDTEFTDVFYIYGIYDIFKYSSSTVHYLVFLKCAFEPQI